MVFYIKKDKHHINLKENCLIGVNRQNIIIKTLKEEVVIQINEESLNYLYNQIKKMRRVETKNANR